MGSFLSFFSLLLLLYSIFGTLEVWEEHLDLFNVCAHVEMRRKENKKNSSLYADLAN